MDKPIERLHSYLLPTDKSRSETRKIPNYSLSYFKLFGSVPSFYLKVQNRTTKGIYFKQKSGPGDRPHSLNQLVPTKKLQVTARPKCAFYRKLTAAWHFIEVINVRRTHALSVVAPRRDRVRHIGVLPRIPFG